MALSVDTSGTAPRPDPHSLAAWAGDQRIFISSVMADDMAPLRTRLVDVMESLGAEPVWFEAFGGRDDDAEVAYLSEVDSSSVYLGILGRTYGRLDKATRMSATHAEYRRAEQQGLGVSVWVSGDEDVQADQKAFIDEVRTFHTTGSFSNTATTWLRVCGGASLRWLPRLCRRGSSWAEPCSGPVRSGTTGPP
jgi:Domain of unknown function (DUF4062)